MTRRTFAFGATAACVAFAMGGVRYAGENALVRPPGGQDEERLFSLCLRCEKCNEACPKGIIRPAHIEDGIVGMRMPEMTFEASWCDFCAEENQGTPLCVKACPTEALKLDEGATAENTVIGKAKITNEWCLAYSLMGCRYCYDACPFGAIELDEEMRPVVVWEACTGCGACEAACVSLKEGSIASGATSRAIVVAPIEREGV